MTVIAGALAAVAAGRPDLVAGLVLVGPTSDPAARTPAQQLARRLLRRGAGGRPTSS